MSWPEEVKARARANMLRHFRALNKLDPHLGCVVCRGPLADGVCSECEGRETGDE